MSTHDYVHDIREIDGLDTARFGGKGAGIARMVAAGIPVPPAFVIGTDGYRAYREGGALPAEMVAQVHAAMRVLEAQVGRKFGEDSGDGLPLLVSVRSGAQISMPGMMDTVLNLGITAHGAAQLAAHLGSGSFAVDTYLRFWRMFSEIVLDIDADAIAAAAQPLAEKVRAQPTQAEFEGLAAAILAAIAAEGVADVSVADVSVDPHWQLTRAIAAVFESWDSKRARAYRAHNHIADDLGTAVTVQVMVFGNLDAQSGSGVAFTRDPNSGEPSLYGEFMFGRQGEDLVSGSATPTSIAAPDGLAPEHRDRLREHGARLEKMYRDAVDIEFTIESNRLFLLQVRAAKRTASAAVRIAVDLVREGLISEATALRRVSTEQLKKLLRPEFESAALGSASVLTSGIAASPGHALGVAVLDADRAATLAASGEKVVLLRPTTSPQDIRGMLASQAVVTVRGGALSHAAVVSRALDIPCIVGCETLDLDVDARTFGEGGTQLKEGDPLSVDGATGKVYSGSLPLAPSTGSMEHIARLLGWADRHAGVDYWVAGTGGADVRDALQRGGPRGVGVIALTDLLITAGTLDNLIEAVNQLSHRPESKATRDQLACLTYEACRHLLLEAPGVAVDLRLPYLGSPRAQRMISTWASLAPRLFLPLGMKSFYAPLLRGIADAMRESNHVEFTPLVPGINGAPELNAFRTAAVEVGIERVGAVLRSPCALADMAAIANSGSALWIDLREVIRTFYGYPSALSFGDDVFEVYAAEGHMPHNPRTKLGTHLGALIRDAVARARESANPRLGMECGEGVALSLFEDLYDAGVRTFSVPAAALPSVRLALGRHVSKE